nr:class I SAM-dependent methyltransferase [Intrasporangium chromatireducens]
MGPVGGRAATTPASGRLLYDFVLHNRCGRVLELGFAHGNSTCYMAAALDELGGGSILTIDREAARLREPNIIELLAATGLAKYVEPIFAQSSYNWELLGLLERQRDGHTTRPLFDFVFVDGAHTWETDGLAFVLADKLLRPGGWILFDDIHWTIAASKAASGRRPTTVIDPAERVPQVGRVFALLVMQHPNYERFEVHGNWGWARKRRTRQEEALPEQAVSRLYETHS